MVLDRDWRVLWEGRFDDPLSDAGPLELDESCLLRSIGDVPRDYGEVDAHYVGLIKIRNDYVDAFVRVYCGLERQSDGCISIDTTAFFQRLIDEGWHLQAVPVDRGWVEVYTLADLSWYRRLYPDSELSKFVSHLAQRPLSTGNLILL